MAERLTGKIISNYMGHGYEQYDAPDEARAFLWGRIHSLLEQRVDLSKPGNYKRVIYPLLGMDAVVDLDQLEEFKSCVLEIACLDGNKYLIDSIIGRRFEDHV